MKHFYHFAGFTLLEVMVALVMIAVAFSAIYLSLSTSTRNQAALQDKTAATWVGLNVIAKKQAQLLTTQTTGKEVMFYENWDWQLKSQATPNPAIIMLEVSVSKESNKKTVTHLIGYLTKSSPS
jgi:general secretion pathway protein I